MRVNFTEQDLEQFPPQVREALTRLALQQDPTPQRAPPSPGGFKVIARETLEDIEARIKANEGKAPFLIDRLSPYPNPVLPKE